MTDHSVMVDGKKVVGALLDFAILIFHNGKIMANSGATFDDRYYLFFNKSIKIGFQNVINLISVEKT